MPSIPQSLLWISLVVLWLFVLVPMLVSKRDAVRRTSDVALATRVLNSAAGARLLKRSGPAAGHRSDPDWQPEEDYDDLDDEAHDSSPTRSAVVRVGAADENAEPDYLDVDVVDEHSGALPVGSAETIDDQADGQADDLEPEFETEEVDDDADVGGADDYEYVEDTSGLEVEDGSSPIEIPVRSRRRRYDMQTAAAVGARKYRFRKRVLTAMALILVASAVAAFTVTGTAWWVCGSAAAVTILYLGYLRRQTRIEERLRCRRMQRVARSQLGVENTYDRDLDVVPSRLHQPGAAVLEIDDEDPSFEHLDYASFARDTDWSRDLPRAAGQ